MTTTIYLIRHGLEPIPMPDLREINYGEWEGQKRSEVREKFPELTRRLRIDPTGGAIPGGESFAQVVERVMRAFNKIRATEQDGRVAVVSHAFSLKVLTKVCPEGIVNGKEKRRKDEKKLDQGEDKERGNCLRRLRSYVLSRYSGDDWSHWL